MPRHLPHDPSKRRTWTGERGIYFADVPNATGGTTKRYEISYRDATGRRRWETIPHGGITVAREVLVDRQAAGAAARRRAQFAAAEPSESPRRTPPAEPTPLEPPEWPPLRMIRGGLA